MPIMSSQMLACDWVKNCHGTITLNGIKIDLVNELMTFLSCCLLFCLLNKISARSCCVCFGYSSSSLCYHLCLCRENLFSDCIRGCFVVACTLCAFISLVWLREQIITNGGPAWLEPNVADQLPQLNVVS